MNIQTIGVVGAGTMGRGIAAVAALKGYDVWLTDSDQGSLDRAHVANNKLLRKLFPNVAAGAVEQVQSRIRYTDDLAGATSTVGLVIEAIVEDAREKRLLFGDLDKICPPETILATNTSTLLVSEIAMATDRPDKCVGMHFFNPVHSNLLLEVARSAATSDDTLEATVDIGHRMGKTVITMQESAGGIAAYLNVVLFAAAADLAERGIASPVDIDLAVTTGLKAAIGPFAGADLVGLDARSNNMTSLFQRLGSRYAPPQMLLDLVEAGKLGRKSGAGFYDYPTESAAK